MTEKQVIERNPKKTEPNIRECVDLFALRIELSEKTKEIWGDYQPIINESFKRNLPISSETMELFNSPKK